MNAALGRCQLVAVFVQCLDRGVQPRAAVQVAVGSTGGVPRAGRRRQVLQLADPLAVFVEPGA